MNSFSTLHWIITAVIFYAIYRAAKGLFAGGGRVMHCLDCGTEAESNMHTPGSTLIEIVLWLCFIVPGLIYSFWRISARKHACLACGSQRLIPPISPAAMAHKQQLSIKK